MPPPRVSLLLCVHNGANHLSAALDSIFKQSFSDFELIAVDDGSTDDTPRVLAACADPRLVALTQPHAGLTKSLNRALAQAGGEYVARHDADDLSHPTRLEKQASFLDTHSDVALVGTGARVVGEHGTLVREFRYPTDDASLRGLLWQRFNPFPHSSVMMRRAVALELGGWDERFVKSQDYEFYLRLTERHQVANLSEPLITLRFRPDSMFSDGETGEQLKYALLAYALACLRRDHPNRVPPRGRPLPLEQFEAWYRATPYPAHFTAGQRRREAQIAFRQGELAIAARHLAQALRLDPFHLPRRVLRLPDRSMIELAQRFAEWVNL